MSPSRSASPSCAARIRAVLRRAGPRAQQEHAALTARSSSTAARASCAARACPCRLTFSEFEVMAALMSSPGRLFNRQELMRAIWGD